MGTRTRVGDGGSSLDVGRSRDHAAVRADDLRHAVAVDILQAGGEIPGRCKRQEIVDPGPGQLVGRGGQPTLQGRDQQEGPQGQQGREREGAEQCRSCSKAQSPSHGLGSSGPGRTVVAPRVAWSSTTR
jgi:hypothetical protein